MKFKAGDWVISSSGTIHRIIQYEDRSVIITDEYDYYHKRNFVNMYKLWQPQKAEWCWFYNGDMNFAVLGQYYGYEEGKHTCVQYTYGNYEDYTFCEPFIGHLPTNTKGNKWN